MKKFVFGIAAVFSVQICFQVLMSVDLIDADYFAMGSPSFVDARSPATVASIDPADLQVAPAVDTPIRPATRSQLDQPVMVLARATRHYAVPLPTQAIFKPVVITYHRPPTSEALAFNGGKKAVQTKPSVKPDDDKSFFAKALPVIKKPYDLLKAVASRLR